MEKQKKNLGSVAFLPLIVFLVCYVGCGITFTLMGEDDPFGKFPRHVALLAGCAVALLLNRSMEKLRTHQRDAEKKKITPQRARRHSNGTGFFL